MVDDAYMAEMAAMQKANAAAMAEQMKQLGMDPTDLGGMGSTYDDPELAELDAYMNKRGKCSHIDFTSG